MRRTLHKLVIGNPRTPVVPQNTIRGRWGNLVAIWENTYEEDAGLEKLVRLVLAASQFLFPGVYIKHLFWRKGPLVQDFVMELYILTKTLLPLVVMALGAEASAVAFWMVVWLMVETIMYIPTMLFASDALPSPRSYRRSKLLIFLNYLDVVFSFAMVHMAKQYMNQPFDSWTDAVYVSFVITSTIGFGEFYPVTGMGKLVVALQSLFYLSYIALFISLFNVSYARGYFGELGRKQ